MKCWLVSITSHSRKRKLISINWIKRWLNYLNLNSFYKTTLPYTKNICSLNRPWTWNISWIITDRFSPYTRNNWTYHKPIAKEIRRNWISLSNFHNMCSISSLEPSLRVPSKITSIEGRSTAISHTTIKEWFPSKWWSSVERWTSWHLIIIHIIIFGGHKYGVLYPTFKFKYSDWAIKLMGNN